METFNRRDVEEWVNLFHPDVRMVPSPYWAPPGTVYHGRPGMRSYAHEVFGRIPRARALPPQTLHEIGDLAIGKVMMFADGDQTADDAKPIHVLYSFRDGQIFTMEGFMSATEALEAAQWRSGTTFRLLFENTFEAVLLNDDEGTVVDANAPAAALYGLDVEDLRGRTIFEFAPPELAGALRSSGVAFGSAANSASSPRSFRAPGSAIGSSCGQRQTSSPGGIWSWSSNGRRRPQRPHRKPPHGRG